jgi:hypothetical protein
MRSFSSRRVFKGFNILITVLCLLSACNTPMPHEQLNGTWKIGRINPDGTFTGPSIDDPEVGVYYIDFSRGYWRSKGPAGEFEASITLISEEADKVTFKMTPLLEGDTVYAYILDNDHVRFVAPGTIVEAERVK